MQPLGPLLDGAVDGDGEATFEEAAGDDGDTAGADVEGAEVEGAEEVEGAWPDGVEDEEQPAAAATIAPKASAPATFSARESYPAITVPLRAAAESAPQLRRSRRYLGHTLLTT